MPVDNHLYIKAGHKNGKTFLQQSFSRQPFKVANITEDKNEDLLRLMIMSSSPGILNNDDYLIGIDVEERAAVEITTQGYQRLFTMSNCATQHMNIRIADTGSFRFLPHPSVPHKASNFFATNNIYLLRTHNLVWSEIITCGRKHCGEEFEFTRFQTLTNIYLENKLVVKENVLMEPVRSNPYTIGQLEGYSHQSTLLFINDRVDMIKMSAQCHKFLSQINNILFGVSMLPVNGIIVRILGHHAEELFNCNNDLAKIISQENMKRALPQELI